MYKWLPFRPPSHASDNAHCCRRLLGQNIACGTVRGCCNRAIATTRPTRSLLKQYTDQENVSYYRVLQSATKRSAAQLNPLIIWQPHWCFDPLWIETG
ncbi:hypothetical protein CY34DRAFT_673882 [Suillus luteus UH-Slu-Lm8-n1]|uniref:Uncharacterized protein n=1 Tax=Suillus luteus UH-Slu-Lm8-n1 TaxID=930992 RepID=A0A0D0BKZ5_9AGAM|nr:hypothetical protein CY34DRAFT_673882 [Suillus luteus UH-Slu-Lm8-n1]